MAMAGVRCPGLARAAFTNWAAPKTSVGSRHDQPWSTEARA
jgi:hypothetical protein